MRGGRIRAGAVRFGEATDLLRVRRQRERLDSLEVAVRENVELASLLAEVVDEIEQDLLPLLERSRTTSM